jgi:nucleotide-binding universal stress UspA family protein
VNPRTRVLTAVDFSEPARAAFDHALVLSRTHNAELSVVHVVTGDRSFEWQARERIASLSPKKASGRRGMTGRFDAAIH